MAQQVDKRSGLRSPRDLAWVTSARGTAARADNRADDGSDKLQPSRSNEVTSAAPRKRRNETITELRSGIRRTDVRSTRHACIGLEHNLIAVRACNKREGGDLHPASLASDWDRVVERLQGIDRVG